MTWTINSEHTLESFIENARRLFDQHKYVTYQDPVFGATRSTEQNRLQRMWMLEAEKQGDQKAEEYRGYCKLHFGVGILKRDSEEFTEKYDRIIKPLSYEEKLELMMVPFDFPVTRGMKTQQKTEYLNLIQEHFEGLGFQLTMPPERNKK